MSYANRKEMGSNRTAAIVVVALIHVALGYALISGLAYNVVKKAAEDLKTFDVKEEPPPPEEKPPPPDNKNPPPPQVSAPPPLVRIESPAPQIQTTPVIQPVIITPRAPTAPPAPPAPPAPRKVQTARAKGSLTALFSSDDYPPSALRDDVEGTAKASLTIGTDGRVTACSIIQSSGSSALDAATCSVLKRRARYTPARDDSGNPTTDTQNTPAISWRIPR